MIERPIRLANVQPNQLDNGKALAY
ncbi:hypothetical protein VARIO8X_50280 [Burkholderiales bacterium 8X]|nr:hypothetical protein VARIO8X_50280 [Burkholderiales bacterium 8X]